MKATAELDTGEFVKAFHRVCDQMDARGQALADQVGEAVASEMKRLAPAGRSGRLRRSIRYRVVRDRLGWYAELTVNVFYASFIEWGTRHTAAVAFFRGGLEHAPAAVRRFAGRLDR